MSEEIQIIDERAIWDKFVGEVQKTIDLSGEMGIFVDGLGGLAHRNGEGEAVVDIAEQNEFGTNKIPSRSFIRSFADGQEEKINEAITLGIAPIIVSERDPQDGWQIMGEKIIAEIQAKIREGIPPENAPL